MKQDDLLADIKRLEQELRRPEPLRARAAAHRRTGVSAMNAWYLAEEPAAYLCLDISRLRAGHCADKVLRFNKPKQAHIVDIVPLYPKREWVGLTDKEILADDVLRYCFGLNGGAGPVSKSGRKIVDALEAKLKEKNT